MIYLTGDIHCPIDVSKLNRKQFPEQKNLSKDDYLIICGDVGLVWEEGSGTDRWWQKWFEDKKFTTLFIDGFKFFTMGGAESNDKAYRKEGISWWPEEMPAEEEYDEALKNLNNTGWQVDFVITHTAPDNILHMMESFYKHNKLTNFLFKIDSELEFSHWYFGHLHEDRKIDEKHTVLYQNIIKLE